MNWVSVLLWALGIYLYLLLGTIVSAYSWKIYRRKKGNWDYPLSNIIFWPLSYLIKDNRIFLVGGDWVKDEYIVMSSIFWVPRLIWNAFWWVVIALVAILRVLIFRLLAYPFKKATKNIQ